VDEVHLAHARRSWEQRTEHIKRFPNSMMSPESDVTFTIGSRTVVLYAQAWQKQPSDDQIAKISITEKSNSLEHDGSVGFWTSRTAGRI